MSNLNPLFQDLSFDPEEVIAMNQATWHVERFKISVS
jgi:hypothetical protein